ncbi:MAG: FHA domain-containing protein [Bacteroidaceae bacterium]|nr:FHA domain-containing protein [Bacteroidaceae bacterium]
MKKIYTIGRGEECDIVIADNTDVISRLHATIRVEANDKIFLVDQSRNGTYVNGMKMSSNVEVPVSRKDVVSFAHIYNLDWSMIPKYKSHRLRNILIALAFIIITTGVTYAIIENIGPSETTPLIEQTEITNKPNEENVVTSDSIEVRDSVSATKDTTETKKPKKQRTSRKQKKEEKVRENDTIIATPEVIENPIY